MEPAPLKENLDSKEMLINKSSQMETLNNSGKVNIDELFVEYEPKEKCLENNDKIIIPFTSFRVMVIVYSILFLFIIIFVSLFIGLKILYTIIILIIGIIIILIIFILSNNKLVITKDESNNKVYIKVINYLCFPKKTIILDKENTHFYAIGRPEQDLKNDTTLIVINDHKNLRDIDLDASNIRQKPAKFYYYFNNINTGNYSFMQYTEKLNNFIGPNEINQDPLNKENHDKCCCNSYLRESIKFSDHFLTFNLDYSCFYPCKYCCLIFLNITMILILVSLLIYNSFKNPIIIIIYPVVNIIIFIIYKCIEENEFRRIDCIYSKTFDRIFIGLVKLNEASYVKTFEYQINDIDKFILQRQANCNITNFILTVIFKNDESQNICIINNINRENLEELAYFLNERIIKNRNITSD